MTAVVDYTLGITCINWMFHQHLDRKKILSAARSHQTKAQCWKRLKMSHFPFSYIPLSSMVYDVFSRKNYSKSFLAWKFKWDISCWFSKTVNSRIWFLPAKILSKCPSGTEVVFIVDELLGRERHIDHTNDWYRFFFYFNLKFFIVW